MAAARFTTEGSTMPGIKLRLPLTTRAPRNDLDPVTSMASPAQCRAGRALLDLAQAEFARCAGVSCRTLAAYERGRLRPHLDVLRRITETLCAFGIALIRGNGVQLARRGPSEVIRNGAATCRRRHAGAEPASERRGRIHVDLASGPRATALDDVHPRSTVRFRLLH
jgi:transcriptional regulator with XRE-family HTH domain